MIVHQSIITSLIIILKILFVVSVIINPHLAEAQLKNIDFVF